MKKQPLTSSPSSVHDHVRNVSCCILFIVIVAVAVPLYCCLICKLKLAFVHTLDGKRQQIERETRDSKSEKKMERERKRFYEIFYNESATFTKHHHENERPTKLYVCVVWCVYACIVYKSDINKHTHRGPKLYTYW